MKQLIVTADDFGAAVEVNRAVERAHLDGVLSAASLMVSGPWASDAVERARRLPKLRVGLHLVLVEGRPLLPAKAVPGLVDEEGNFRRDLGWAGARMFFLPKVRAQLKAEIEAQFAAFARTGLALDHVNAHKHFHLHPAIAAFSIEGALKYGAKGIRVPLEPSSILSRVEPCRSSALRWLTAPFANGLARRMRARGLGAPNRVFGLCWSGAMTSQRLKGLLAHLPGGVNEIYLHPATGSYPGSAPGYRYGEEFAALTDPEMPRLIAARDIRLGGYCDFLIESSC